MLAVKIIHAVAMPELAEAGGVGARGGCRPGGAPPAPPQRGQAQEASSEPAVFLFAHKQQPTASQGGTGARAG